MSVLGHVAAGAVAARATAGGMVSARRLLAWAVAFAALGLLPDVDLVLHAVAPSVQLFAHRGPSHSLAVALVVGALAAAVAPAVAPALGARSGGRLRLGIVVAAVVGSHGLLDALGTSRVGVELLWPFTGIRFLAPWHVLPNVDLTRPLPSIVGVLLFELALFTPAWLFALWPRRRPERTGPLDRGPSGGPGPGS